MMMILTKHVFDVSVWLTEYSVTVESVTLRFYVQIVVVGTGSIRTIDWSQGCAELTLY